MHCFMDHTCYEIVIYRSNSYTLFTSPVCILPAEEKQIAFTSVSLGSDQVSHAEWYITM